MENLEGVLADPAFREKQKRYVVKFMLNHPAERAQLQAGRVLGRKEGKHVSEGWRNVTEHCLMAGLMADTLGRLLDLPEEDVAEVVSEALTHDADKRDSIEATRAKNAAESNEDGVKTIAYDPEKYRLLERDKTGLVKVTGNDWRDYPSWGFKEKILRFVDSSVGENSAKKSTILNWRDRIADLEVRHAKLNQLEGEALYDMPLYTRLRQMMEEMEAGFYQQIVNKRPEFVDKYPNPASLNELILSELVADINSI